jgi:hypothetical protein
MLLDYQIVLEREEVSVLPEGEILVGSPSPSTFSPSTNTVTEK